MRESPGVGKVLAGRYRIDGVLGHGGMGVVYEALDLQSGGRVALKLLRSELAGHPVVVKRFLREMRVMRTLTSPHIVGVLDAGQLACGAPYLVMELLDGCGLEELLEQEGSLPVGMAAEIGAQACAALRVAHGVGVVHRDLKPSNFFLTWDDEGRLVVKLLDFGLAKIERLAFGICDDSGITRVGMILGTLCYMAPEQIARPSDVDRRADLWSLGAMLYEMLTGASPFHGVGLADVIRRVVHVEAPAMSASIPRELERAVMRCLRKKACERFASASSLAEVLRRHAEADIPAPRQSVTRCIGYRETMPARASSAA